MKVLFVRSGNMGISPISTNQGESLKKFGVNINYYDIKGKGLGGYLRNILPLKNAIYTIKPDIIHAHYYLSGLIAIATLTRTPVIVSLMGSDVLDNNNLMLFIMKFLIKKKLWSRCIVKSTEMYKKLNISSVEIIPNGVDLDLFSVIDRKLALKKLGWDDKKYHILFPSNPARYEKNYKLIIEAQRYLKREILNKINIHHLVSIDRKYVPLYFNAANLILLTSLHEGSPNVIKEAMACNCPIVSTNVGDVKEIIGRTKGCFITSYDPKDVAEKIELALDFSEKYGRTNGRQRIIELELDSDSIAKRIIQLYNSVLNI